MLIYEEDESSVFYQRINGLRNDSVIIALSQIDWKEDDRIISIACGDCPFEIYILQNYKVHGMICIDINKYKLKDAAEKAKENNVKNIIFQRKDLACFNLDDYKGITKILCFGYSWNPLNLLFTLFRKKDLFDFLQSGGKFLVYPAEGGHFFGKSITDNKTIYNFNKTLTSSIYNYMDYFSNIFETKVYNNTILEIGRCLLEEDFLKDFLTNIRSDYSCKTADSLVNI